MGATELWRREATLARISAPKLRPTSSRQPAWSRSRRRNWCRPTSCRRPACMVAISAPKLVQTDLPSKAGLGRYRSLDTCSHIGADLGAENLCRPTSSRKPAWSGHVQPRGRRISTPKKGEGRLSCESRPSKPRQRPTLPQGCPCSTIGPGELNFRVRDGNGCDLSGITARKKSTKCEDARYAERRYGGCRAFSSESRWYVTPRA